MFIVTRDGKRVPLNYSFDETDLYKLRSGSKVGVYDDDVILKPIWLITLMKNKNIGYGRFHDPDKYEFVAEYKYEHKPTKDDILYLMSMNGMVFNDIVTIDEGYELDVEYDD